MPEGHQYNGEHSLINPSTPYSHNAFGNNSTTANILKSVKDQEVQFERLTRKLEEERQSVARQIEQCRVGSETTSMESISSTDETFQWGGPQTHYDSSYLHDDTLQGDQSKMSSHLLDSCLRELEDRGTMNLGEDNINYLPEDQYNGRIPEHTSLGFNPSYPNGGHGYGSHNNIGSVHSSHASLHSTGSNRNAPRPTGKGYGSQSSLPHGQHNDNYMYSGPPRNYEDQRGSPLPQTDSPRGPGTPTRFNQHPDPYHSSSQLYDTNVPRYGVHDSFDNSLQRPPHDDSFDHYDTSRDGPVSDNRYGYPNDDRYGDPPYDDRLRGGPPVEDSFYRQSPMLDDRYGGPPPADDRYRDPPFSDREPLPQDRYLDHPDDSYRGPPHDDRYGGPPQDDRYGGPPQDDSFRGAPPADNYRGHPADDSYRDQPRDDSFRGQYPDDSYRSPQDDGYRGPPPNDNYRDQHPDDRYRDDFDDSYIGEPPDERGFRAVPEERFRDPIDERYRDPEDEGFRDQPDNRYRDAMDDSPLGPQGDMGLRGLSLDNRYRDADQHDDSYVGVAPEDRAPNSPQEDRYGEPHNDSYRGSQHDLQGYPGPPGDDRYRDESFQGQPPNQYGDRHPDDSFQEPQDRYNEGPPDDRYNQAPPHGDEDRYREYAEDPYGRRVDPDRRHEGLPPVRSDPFADDPFQGEKRSMGRGDEDPYPRGHSPAGSSDRMGPGSYSERPPQYEPRDQFNNSGQGYPDDTDAAPYYPREDIPRSEATPLRAGPDNYSDGRRTPSQEGTMRWRQPDLTEVIDYLSHPSDAIKANAAAYLQHLCYMDDDIKTKARSLGGIPPIVELLNSDFPEVHRNACGALKNLSYGSRNDDNKRAIKTAGGIPNLVRLLRKTQDEDTRELVTGVLWNLSSCQDLKKPIIDDGLAVLVNVVIIPLSGLESRGVSPYHEPFTIVFKNATGVLRNVSSSGAEARKKLRECHGLVDSLIHSIKNAVEQGNIDNKAIENCMCTLRNLAFRIQEVEDPDFYKKRTLTLTRQKQQQTDKAKPGCFGGGGKKKTQPKGKPGMDTNTMAPPRLPPGANEYRGLWSPDGVKNFLLLLAGSNRVMLEAACGCLQNLVACDWQPAVEIRSLVRKEKGLPSLVDLLTHEDDKVVCAAAAALRNLAIDERNKELIGKYAMKQLVSRLRQLTGRAPANQREKDEQESTICALLATLHEVVQHNQDFARSFVIEDGLPRLMFITKNRDVFYDKTVRYAVTVLKALWKFKVLQQEYTGRGYTERDFDPPMPARSSDRTDGTGQPSSNRSTPYNTLNRPYISQGYDDTTLSSRQNKGGYPASYNQNGRMDGHPGMVQGHSNPALAPDQDRYSNRGSRNRVDEIPMADMGPGYAPIEEQRSHRTKPPVGGVPLFPNLPPNQHQLQHQQQHDPDQSSLGPGPHEPLYARVNKSNKRRPEDMGEAGGRNIMLDDGQAGADSWV